MLPGELVVCQNGTVIAGPWACLGRAARELATMAGNPHRDPVAHDGDTPLGIYA